MIKDFLPGIVSKTPGYAPQRRDETRDLGEHSDEEAGEQLWMVVTHCDFLHCDWAPGYSDFCIKETPGGSSSF